MPLARSLQSTDTDDDDDDDELPVVTVAKMTSLSLALIDRDDDPAIDINGTLVFITVTVFEPVLLLPRKLTRVK